jgi:thiosulfate reductase/polysulfide reductase chain A
MTDLSRRQFIKIGGAGAGAMAFTGFGSNWWGLDANSIHDPATDGDRIVPTFCELCFWKCGVLAHVKVGQVTKIVGNPAHPLSRGRLCPRGTGGIGLLYDPDRLKVPLLRVKKRGEEVFEETTWDKALDVVAENMIRIKEKHGPEAFALFLHGYGGSWFKHLMKYYGSPNVAAPSYAQCRGPREVGFWLTFGQGVGSPEATDIANTRCLTLIGSHLGENMHNTQVQDMADAIGRGAELVVVDPRFSVAASKARYWLPIKPGTDMALLLAWMHVIVTEKRYDIDYINKHASGFAELEDHIKDKTPEWAYPITGLKPELIRETARFIASFKPASLIHPGRRTTWYGDDAQRSRAIAILAALLGSWGRKGGYNIPTAMEVPPYPYIACPTTPKDAADKAAPNLYPLSEEVLASGLCDATIPGKAPYDLKGWLVYGTNLLHSLPDPRQVQKAIQELDFIAAIDVLPTEICGWADVVLPECTYLERYDDVWFPAYKEPFVALRQPAVEPMYDSRPGSWIAREIGLRLGLEPFFPWKEGVEAVRHRVESAGLSWTSLEKDGVVLGDKVPVTEEEGLVPTFYTDSGKIELHSKPLAMMGFDPIPNYTALEEPPVGMFRLLIGRSPVHTFSRTTNNRFLSQCHSENEVWLNADAAKALPGFEHSPLQSGDRVILENQDGIRSNPIKVKITERIRGDCVYMVHGFGHTAKGLSYARGRGASDASLITRYKTDPIMGGTGMNLNFVRILSPEAAA